ncbi:hypothetical protein ACUH7Y_13430 [Clostridium beijerinckii]|uniref:Uncharacterized protein n=1 Tax=Clostridium beijerinckii TaxID=1520 RepID=A0A1S8S9U8_CLOBE|nr:MULTISPECIES: hypothetical protein [Clostridium]MBA8934802.1 hypothetical protein [Clostridium beijerinckii]MBN7574079.1 hypothetical protein [Clostridium beijerinckii]MBN7577907.1 hypothetical protein [Clostridium beijerinckii]MBN7583829.1 hypothetical protein [Clostridium beijerinckii]MBO0518892.1 hypothetical protein [Clostridium beijerinckii]
MNKARCLVVSDFTAIGGIIIKAGTICEVLNDGEEFIWINPYIKEADEEIPIPILKSHVRFL